jgi:sulfatase maturation enzyme AslB (radical SAM superfamily)
LTEETDRIPGASECGTCEHRPYCAVCPGRLQAETGSFTETAPYVCEVARRMHTAAGGDQG